MKPATQVQILNESVYVSFYANALGKGMNSFVFCTSMGKNSADKEEEKWTQVSITL